MSDDIEITPRGIPLALTALRVLGGRGTAGAVTAEAARLDPTTDPEKLSANVASALTNAKKRGLVSNTERGGEWILTEAGAVELEVPTQTRGARRPRIRQAFVDDPAPEPHGRVRSTHVAHLSTGELMRMHAAVVAEARRREVIKTGNLIGEWAEVLIEHAVGGWRPGASEKAWDVFAPDSTGISADAEGNLGRRVQVKGRMVWDPKNDGQYQLGSISSKGSDMLASFEDLAIVIFAANFGVQLAVLLSVDVVAEVHEGVRDLIVRDSMVFHPNARDITAAVRAASEELGAQRPLLKAWDWNNAMEVTVPSVPAGSSVRALSWPNPWADDPDERSTFYGKLFWYQNPHTHGWDAFVDTANGVSQVDARTIIVESVPDTPI